MEIKHMVQLPHLRHYPLSLLCILCIICLSTFPIGEHPELADVPFVDKWTHMVMYGGLTFLLWAEHLRRHRPPVLSRLLVYGFLFPVALGGAMELVQWPIPYRGCEWLDFLANTIGSALVALCGYAYASRMKA